jgi:G3E family GTPase
LTAAHGKKLAVIETEFGEVGIDDKLLAKNTKMQCDEELIEMMNGCICCTVRQDLVVVLTKFAKRLQQGLQLDGIIIETTGMADPAPVAQTFFVHDEVQAFFRLDGIVTLIDAKHIEQHLDEEKPEGAENEAVEQVAFADRMLLNKTDLVTGADLTRVEGRLRAINKFAPIQRCCKSEVSVDSVLNIRGFDLTRTLEMDPEFLNTDGEHEHDNSISSLSIIQPGDVDLELVKEWISGLLDKQGVDIFRTKGVIAIAHAEQKFVYQAVHMIFHGSFEDEEWAEDEARESKLVFIGKNLDKEALKAGFASCLARPEILDERRKELRFAIGDEVECDVGPNSVVWAKGVVVAQLIRDDGLAPGTLAPYQVRLDDGGDLVWAPIDDDKCIRRAGSAKKSARKTTAKTTTTAKAVAKKKAIKKASTTKVVTKKAVTKKTKKAVTKKAVTKKTNKK